MRLTVRRAVTATAVLALAGAGALAIALPAHAAALTVSGTATCDHNTGRWQVSWSISADAGSEGTVTDVTAGPDGSTASGLAVDDVIGAGPTQVSQSSPGDETVVTLAVTVDWTAPEPSTESVTGEVTKSDTCVEDHPVPSATFDSRCDGGVTVTLANDATVVEVEFEITADAAFSATRTVAAGSSTTVDVPAAAAGLIVIQADHQTLKTGGWQDPGGCATSAPPTSAAPTTAPPTAGGGDDEPTDEPTDDPTGGTTGSTSSGGRDGGHPTTGTRTSRSGTRATTSPTPSDDAEATEPAVEEAEEQVDGLADPAAVATQPAPVALSGHNRDDDTGWGDTAVLILWVGAAFAVVCLIIVLLTGIRRKRGRRRYERYVSPFADFH